MPSPNVASEKQQDQGFIEALLRMFGIDDPRAAGTFQEKTKVEGSINLDINNRVFPFGDSARQIIARLFSALGYNYSMHDLRHTYATTLVAAGVDYKTVSELMGHGVNMTMKTYSHVNEDMRVRAAKVIDRIF